MYISFKRKLLKMNVVNKLKFIYLKPFKWKYEVLTYNLNLMIAFYNKIRTNVYSVNLKKR